MMKRRILTAIIGSIVLIVPLTTLAQRVPTFFVHGIGNNSCGQFLQAADNERKVKPPSAAANAYYSREYIGYLRFADGFLTGANWGAAMRSDKIDAQVGSSTNNDGFVSAMAWLENDCREHPLNKYSDAVQGLRGALAAKEQR